MHIFLNDNTLSKFWLFQFQFLFLNNAVKFFEECSYQNKIEFTEIPKKSFNSIVFNIPVSCSVVQTRDKRTPPVATANITCLR